MVIGLIVPSSFAIVAPSAPGNRPNRLSNERFSLITNTTCLIGVVVCSRIGSTWLGGWVAPGEVFPGPGPIASDDRAEAVGVESGDDVQATAATTIRAADVRTARRTELVMRSGGGRPIVSTGHPLGIPVPASGARDPLCNDDAGRKMGVPMRPLFRPLVLLAVVGVAVLPARAFATTVPVRVTAPRARSFVRRRVPVMATAPGADSVTFQRARHVGGPFHAILPPDTTPGDGWHVPWDTSGLADGAWYLRAKAAAPGGPFLSDPVQVTVDNTAPVATVSASPSSFSPNGDGVRDATFVTLRLSEPAAVELDVVNAAHRVVHRLSSGRHLTAGPHRFRWAGLVLRSGHWRHALDGVYSLRATAVDRAGNTGTATGRVRIDTVAPGFRWVGVSPEPASGSGPVTLSFHSFDPGSSVAASASIWNAVRRVAFVRDVTRPSGASAVQITPPPSPPPGLYRARVVLVDQAGNRTQSRFRPFRIQHPVTTSVVRGFTGVGDRIALTFDDCVFGDAWNSILNTLEARGLRATFFCASINLDRNAAEARRTVADGMSIGSHTRDHPNLTTLSYGQVRAQLEDDVEAWWRIARATPLPLFRPPYGAYDSTVLRAAGSLGFLHTVTWDVDPSDYTDPGVAAIRQRVLSHAHAGMIVIMHVKPETAAALPGLLDALAARGYHQTALDQMFRIGTGGPRLRPSRRSRPRTSP